MTDKIEVLEGAIIQHGKENNRIYLMKIEEKNAVEIVDFMDKLAAKNVYTKIVAKIPVALRNLFSERGYVYEAVVENFYSNNEDACFMSKYLACERGNFDDRNEICSTIQFCTEKAKLSKSKELDSKFILRQLAKSHAKEIAEIYKAVFTSYPFPIFNKKYIADTMKENIDYYGVFDGENLVAVASSEMDLKNLNTEMTDFATLPEYRGYNLSYHLLKQMEKNAPQKGIKTAYTIARAKSTAINMIFAKNGYEFGGTLVNNTNICGNIETMNVWYKSL